MASERKLSFYVKKKPVKILHYGRGQPGKKVEISVTATHIVWRYEGDRAWKNVIALSELMGDPTGLAHNLFPDRNVADCHPIAAITGLQNALNDKLENITGEDHNDLQNRDAADCHPISAITALPGNLVSTFTFVLYSADPAVNVTNNIICPFAVAPSELFIHAKTAPSGENLIIDINAGATRIVQATLPDGDNYVLITSFDVASIAKESVISVDVVQGGNAEDVTIQLKNLIS